MKRNTLISILVLAAVAVFSQAAFAEEADKDLYGQYGYSVLVELSSDKPGGLAYDGELLWVTDRVALKLRGLDPATGEEKRTLESPGMWPTDLAYDGELLWTADRDRNRIFGIDLKNGLVVKEIESPKNPLGLAYDGKHLWVADGKMIHQISKEDGTEIVSFSAPAWNNEGKGSEQLGMAFDNGYLWVSDRNHDTIYKVHPERGDVVDLLPSPGPFPAGLEVVKGKLLIADVERRAIHVVALGTLPAIATSKPRSETIVVRRGVNNKGPGTLKEANLFIAIPQSFPGQVLDGEPEFSAQPLEVVEDQWGQKFAHFKATDLEPGNGIAIDMKVKATLLDTRFRIDPEKVGSLKDIPAAVKKQYLADASKYAIDHPSIAKHVEEALQGEKRPYWMVRKIARHIQDKMHYEMVGGWNVAPTVIDRGSGSCSEYTFVFIAMCRKAGIPARYAGAYVVRGDDASTDETFHRWAEVFLPGYGWIPYDVQAGDKPSLADQAAEVGGLDNRFVITTKGGGDSKYIGWGYNSEANWICQGRCDVEQIDLGDWYPQAKPAGGEEKAAIDEQRKAWGEEQVQPAVTEPVAMEDGTAQEQKPAAATLQRNNRKAVLRTGAWIAWGSGAAALIAGGIAGGVALSKHNKLKDDCPNNNCPPDKQDELNSMERVGTAANVLFVVGAVEAVLGGALYLTSFFVDSDDERQAGEKGASVGVAPAGRGDGAMMTVGGFF